MPATQPAVTVQPPPEVVKIAAKADAGLAKADQGAAVAQAVLTAAATPGANPGAAVVAASPLAGPYAGWVALGGIALSFLWGIQQRRVLTSTVAGVRDALNSGDLTATHKAGEVIDAAVLAHPATNELVDAVHKAAIKTVPVNPNIPG